MRSTVLCTMLCLIAAVFGAFLFTLNRAYIKFKDQAPLIRRSESNEPFRTYNSKFDEARQAYLGGVVPLYKFTPLEYYAVGQYETPKKTYFISTVTNPSFEVVTDDAGFRTKSPRTAPKRIDLLAIGGSNTWGQGLNYNETFAAIVAERLNLKLGNAGVANFSGVESLLRMKRFLHRNPKFVIYGLFEDHMYRNVEPMGSFRPMLAMHEGGREYYIRHGTLSFYGNQFVPKPLQWINSNFLNAYFFQLRKDYVKFFKSEKTPKILVDQFNIGGRPSRMSTPVLPLIIDGQSYILKRMYEEVKKIGAKFIVVAFPLLPREVKTPKQWKNLAKDEGFTFIDIEPFVRSHSYYEIALSDGHYNSFANRYMAERIVEAIHALQKEN